MSHSKICICGADQTQQAVAAEIADRDTLKAAAAPSPKNSDMPHPTTVIGKMAPVAALPR